MRLLVPSKKGRNCQMSIYLQWRVMTVTTLRFPAASLVLEDLQGVSSFKSQVDRDQTQATNPSTLSQSVTVPLEIFEKDLNFNFSSGFAQKCTQ